jgi:hypothetical protein
MGLALQPIVIVLLMTAAVALIGATASLVSTYRASDWIKRSILIVVALVLLAPSGLALICFKPELVDGRYKTYKQLYRNIQAGMSRAEVMTLVDKHYPEDGQRLRPQVVEDSDDRLSFNMNPEGAREPNCEGISVTLQGDNVVYKFYSRD